MDSTQKRGITYWLFNEKISDYIYNAFILLIFKERYKAEPNEGERMGNKTGMP
jgi:hypothetical protein